MATRGAWFTVSDAALSKCRGCGWSVYWVTSQRTGKRYPANVRPYRPEGHRAVYSSWVMPNNPHRCPPPEPSQEDRERAVALDWMRRLVVIWEEQTPERRQMFSDVARQCYGERAEGFAKEAGLVLLPQGETLKS